MSDRQNLAEHGTALVVGGLASAGLGFANLPFTSVAVLLALGLDQIQRRPNHRVRLAVDRAKTALDSTDIPERGITAALQLLRERRRHIQVDPRTLKEAEARAGFPGTLYEIVFADGTVPADDRVEEALRLVLAKAYEELRLEDDFHKLFVQESLADIEGILRGDLAERQAELLARLDRIDAEAEANRAMLETLVDRERDTARQLGIRETQLVALAERIADDVTDPDTAFRELKVAVEEAAELRRRGETPSNLGDFVDAVMARTLARSVEGDLTGAEAEARAGLAAWREKQAEMQAQGLRMMTLVIAQARQTRNIDLIVATEVEKATLEASEPDALYTALYTTFVDWYTRGRDKGLNFDLEVAIALMRHMAGRFAQDRDKKGACLTSLGTALQTLGERETGTDRLDEAIAAYRAALEEWTRDRVPLDWARTQMNLGTALAALGQRETGTDRLEEAVAAYRAALEEYTRDRVPLDWARTQMNLGNALRTLGQRETGTDRLEEAVTAFRAALEEWTRDRVPLDWARTQMNLGTALAALGDRETGTDRLDEAVAAYRAALEEWTRDRVPLDWAMTQMNLGTALWTLGDRETGTDRLEEAVAAYREALKERTRDRVPLDWARTQMNLGTALAALGRREPGTDRLEQAVAAYRAALEERTRDRVPLDWANTIGNEALALMTLAERTEDAALAARARDQLVEAEAVLRDGGHIAWADNKAKAIPDAEALLDRLTAAG